MKQYRLQRRQHPLFSPLAIGSSFALIIALGVAVLLTGGRAFSPGDLSAVNISGDKLNSFQAHAEFNDECARCHTPFQGITAQKCETCHEAVATERQALDGLHARLEMVEQCSRCHSEHHGAEFDLFASALTRLDHDLTGFSLVRHDVDHAEAPLECTGCHAGNKDFELTPDACITCHENHDPIFINLHRTAYGDNCQGCHDGVDTLADFTVEDHANVFLLVGAHEESACEACHAGGKFQGVPEHCVGCHSEPIVHQGVFGVGCADCHATESWRPTTFNGVAFDHARDTRFILTRHEMDYDKNPITCLACHAEDQFQFYETSCFDCHINAQPEFMETHVNQVGSVCLNCHDGSGQIANFDHDTIWPLIGGHLSVECSACHENQVVGNAPRECLACHQEPQIHLGMFGTDCATCHTAESWLPARLTRHLFPLDHGDQGEVDCATCHPSNYAEYSCYGCHEHEKGEVESEHVEEGINYPKLTDCVECHPAGVEDEAEVDD